MILVFFCEFLVEENSCANVNNFTTILVIFHCFCCYPIFSIIFTRSFSSFLFSSFFLWLLSFSQQQHHKSTTNFSATLLCSYLLNPVLNIISNKSTYVFLSIIIIHFTTICNLINTTILSQWSFLTIFLLQHLKNALKRKGNKFPSQPIWEHNNWPEQSQVPQSPSEPFLLSWYSCRWWLATNLDSL